MRVTVLSLLMASIGVSLAQTLEVQEVVAPVGKIRGSFMESRSGRQFFAARGVRYGEPPVGEMRFKQAVPAAPWTNVFDASQEGPSCPQPGGVLPSEDCLRLNIYTPELPNLQNTSEKKPVVVFFHPGGFYFLSGQSSTFGPEYLMDQDIVLVTVNYRLGSLGFISTGDSNASGNLGLKDQVEALRWIRKNIGAFGGDANNVTITGYSAGGWSVSLHMVSPMSKGLFHRAIAMSGSTTYQKRLGSEQTELAKRQARLLNCTIETIPSMMACLRTKPVEEFSKTLNSMFDWNGNPVLLWTPVIEPEIEGVERFLTGEPEDLIRQGKFHHVPLIAGITKDEFAGNMVYWIETSRKGDNSLFDDLNNQWETLAPIVFLYERDTPRSKVLNREFKSFYLNNQRASVDTADGVGKFYADALIGYSVHRLVNLIAQASTKPVWYYEFTYQGRWSFRVWNDTKIPYGVSHHDDLLYLFYMKTDFPYFNTTDPEYGMMKRYTSMWTSFAKTGNPIPTEHEEFRNVIWEPFTTSNKKYLEIGDDLTMKTGLYAERMNKWDELFPLPPLPQTTVKH